MKILVDSSVWINFFQGKASAYELHHLIKEDQVLSHPWIFGEIAVGQINYERDKVLFELQQLLQLPIYSIQELVVFLNKHKLYGLGLSLIDLQLIYTIVQNKCLLWTEDKMLKRCSEKFNLSFQSKNIIQ